MGKKVIKVPLIRVNSNLPMPLYERIKSYANEIGMPITQTIILLLHQGLDYRDNLKLFSNLSGTIEELKTLNDSK